MRPTEMDDTRPSSALGSRRGLQLLPVQTNIKNSGFRPKRPPRPDEALDLEFSMEEVHHRISPIKSQPSKSSLRSLFTRNRPSRQPKLPVIAESQKMTYSTAALETIPSPASTSSTSKASISNPSSHRLSLRSSKPTKEKSQKHRTITSWNPPPLFQACAQAIKHSTLLAPTLSAESILRINGHHHRNNSSKEDAYSEIEAMDEPAKKLTRKRKEEKDRRHSRRVSASISKTEWTHKTYVLLTNGYLLQYAAEGNFDRLPEKMLEIGKDSVAFASDAIPGKHWVLQISHTLDGEGSVALESRKGFLSRFSSSDTRRLTKSFLLVLDSPEELASWIVAVRREIESLGGKDCVPETPLDAPQDLHRLHNVSPNRPPHILEHPAPWSQHSGGHESFARSDVSGTEANTLPPSPPIDNSSINSINRLSNPPRQSVDSQSLSTMATTTDLDRLREDSRLSYISVGTRTIPSSRGSSPGLSPARPYIPPAKGSPAESPRSAKSATLLSSVEYSGKRQSMQTHSPTQADHISHDIPKKFRPQSLQVVSPLAGRNPSNSPPNFSVPAFSKRYSTSPSIGHSSTFSSSSARTSPLQPATPYAPNPVHSTSDITQPIHGKLDSGSPNMAHNTFTRDSSGLYSHFDSSESVEDPPQSMVTNSKTRRFSSFESRGRPNRLFNSDHHTFEIPYVTYAPKEKLQPALSPTFEEESHVTPLTKNSGRQLRRPVSLQSRPDNRPSRESVQNANGDTPSIAAIRSRLPQGGRASISNSDIAKAPKPDIRKLSMNKSMSHLCLGPPPAPPPDCPLPAVPQNASSQFRSSWDERPASQESFQRPISTTAQPKAPREIRYSGSSYSLRGMTPKEASMVNAF